MKKIFVLAWLSVPVGNICAAGMTCSPDVLDKDGKGAALLFSALPLNHSKFAVRWEKARKELEKTLPGLRFEKTENLHVTLSFNGSGWDPAKIPDLEKYGLDGPDLSSGPLTMKGSPEIFGPKKDVLALELTPVPAEWSARLMKDRNTMTELGLRKKDMFDDVFRAHVSLAYARKPGDPDGDIARFQKWMTDRAKRFDGLGFRIDAAVKPLWMLVQGKDDATRFVPLRSYCKDGR